MDRKAFVSLSRDDLVSLILTQAQQISTLTVRIAELEAKLAAPAKTPDNSSVPPSKGQKPNLPDAASKKPRASRPGVARALAEHPDVASVLQQGRIRPAALPSAGQIAPKIYVDAVR